MTAVITERGLGDGHNADIPDIGGHIERLHTRHTNFFVGMVYELEWPCGSQPALQRWHGRRYTQSGHSVVQRLGVGIRKDWHLISAHVLQPVTVFFTWGNNVGMDLRWRVVQCRISCGQS